MLVNDTLFIVNLDTRMVLGAFCHFRVHQEWRTAVVGDDDLGVGRFRQFQEGFVVVFETLPNKQGNQSGVIMKRLEEN
jgi:hypothetical protein